MKQVIRTERQNPIETTMQYEVVRKTSNSENRTKSLVLKFGDDYPDLIVIKDSQNIKRELGVGSTDAIEVMKAIVSKFGNEIEEHLHSHQDKQDNDKHNECVFCGDELTCKCEDHYDGCVFCKTDSPSTELVLEVLNGEHQPCEKCLEIKRRLQPLFQDLVVSCILRDIESEGKLNRLITGLIEDFGGDID